MSYPSARFCRYAVMASMGIVLVSAHAQERKTVFNPSLGLTYGVTSNVGYVGEADEDTSDSTMSLDLNLPFQKENPRNNLLLNYRGTLRRYDRAEVLDHSEHVLDFETEFKTGTRSSLNFSLFGERTQQVADARNIRDDNVFIEERITRTAYGAGLSYGHDLGGRWNWTTTLAGAESTAEGIEDIPSEEPDRAPKNYASYTLNLEFSKTVSNRTDHRIRYSVRLFDSQAAEVPAGGQPDTVQEQVHQLDFTYDRTLSRRSTIGVLAGAFARRRQDQQDLQVEGVALGTSYGYGPVAKTNFGLSLAVAPSSGGNLGGTSTNAVLSLTVGGVENRKLNWGVNSIYTKRFAAVTTDPNVSSIVGFGFVEPIIIRDIGLRFTAQWARQTSDVEGLGDGEFATLSMGLVWYPLLRTKAAGRS